MFLVVCTDCKSTLSGERLIYGDLNFPIDINNKFSGLGNIILNDALHYFTKNPKFESVDGIATLWTENKIYADYGGSSYSMSLEDFEEIFKEKAIIIKK